MNEKLEDFLSKIGFYRIYYFFDRVKNRIKWRLQIITTGHAEYEYWNPDIAIAKFALPLVKSLKGGCSYPADMTVNKWEKILDKMILGLEFASGDEYWSDLEKIKEAQEGLKLFGKHFLNLWD